MATATHAARSRSLPAPKPGAAVSKARKAARPKASWAFDGGGAVGGGDVTVQAKMEVSQPGDVLEREADRVAAHVVTASPPAAATGRAAGREDEAMAHVQRMAAPSAAQEKEEEAGKRVHRLPQSAAQVRAADLADDREEHPPRLARAAMEEDPKKAHRMAMGEEDQKKAHRMAMGEEDEKKVHRRVDDDSERMAPGRVDSDGGAKVHRDAESERFGGEADAVEEDEGRPAGDGRSDFAPPVFEERLRLERLKGGAPLPQPLRDALEPGMHTNLDRVRVHADGGAAALAQSVRARAFTVGRHIFFGSGQFRPQTQQGQRLVAHEVTHVLQQRGGLHSVQREIMDGPPGATSAEKQNEKGEDAAAKAAPDTIEFADLMRIFNLREGVTPPQVLEIIKELLENTLRVLPKAAKLLPFVDPSLARDRTVRRTLRSAAHELRLEATHVTEGPAAHQPEAVGTKWELRFLDGTRAPDKGGQAAGGTDEDAIGVSTGRPARPPTPGADVAGKSGSSVVGPPPSGSTSDTSVLPRAAPAEAAGPDAAAAPAQGARGPAAAAAGAPAAAAAPAGGAGAAPPVESPNPAENPDFLAVTERAKEAADQTSAHTGSEEVAANAKDSADVAASENEGKAQQNQVDTMKRQETPAFNKQAFIDAVLSKVEAITPKNLKQAHDFKPNNVVERAVSDVQGVTKGETDKSRGPLKQATEAPPDPGTVKPRDPAELAPEQVGKAPADIQAAKAVPPERPASVVEDVAAQGQAQVNSKMDELGLPNPEETLANSNEPQMVAALDAKKAVDKDAAAGPAEFRAGEGELLGGARTEVGAAAKAGLGEMFGTRGDLVKGVAGGQTKGKQGAEGKREQAAIAVNQIYIRTRTKVQDRLTSLEGKVNTLFATESAGASKTFQDQVAAAEAKWEDVSFLDKVGQAIDSFLFSLPNELEQQLRVIRASFLQDMRNIVERIATIVADELAAAKADVEQGRADVDKVLGGLGPELDGFKNELRGQFAGKFNSLETDIKATFDNLATQIATKVTASVADADKLLQEVRDRNKSFIEAAVAALGNTITTFLELKAKLESAFAAAKDVVLQILADPITFAKNLFAGIIQGFKNFASNILAHLGHGVIEWLTGAVSEAGIVFPPQLDAEGILSLFLQITGLSVAHVTERARAIWGDKVVDFIEKVVSGVQAGVAGVEQVIEFFQVLRTEGVAGLVRLLKEKIIALKDQALDSIKSALAIEVVAAAIQNLLSLLTPASALVQAVIKIVNVVLFFIQNAGRISELINTIAEGARDVVAGNIGGLAAKVESALAHTIPIVIDFLAALIGLGSGIVNTIKKAIAFVREAVDKAIDAVLNFLKNLALRVLKALGLGPKEKAKEGEKEGEEKPGAPGAHGAIGISVPFIFAGQQHLVFIHETASDASLLVGNGGSQSISSFLGGKAVVESSTEEARNEIRGLAGRTDAAAKRAKKAAANPDPANAQHAAQAEAEVVRDEQALAGALGTLAPAAPDAITSLGEDQSFSAGGEAHSLSIEVSGHDAHVILATNRGPLSTHLAEFRTQAQELSDEDAKAEVLSAINSASSLARSLDKDNAAALASKEPRGNPKRIALNERIIEDERALRPLLATIFDGLGIKVPKKVPGPITITFEKPSSLDRGEYRRQLSGQAAEINDMVVNDWLQQRELFEARGRDPNDPQERRAFRDSIREALVLSLTLGAGNAEDQVKEDPKHLLKWVNETLASGTAAERKNGFKRSVAIRLVDRFMSTQAALHEPDQVAGGEVRPKALGDRDVNRDIGQNWGGIFGKPTPGAAQDLETATRKALTRVPPLFWSKVKMNVKLV